MRTSASSEDLTEVIPHPPFSGDPPRLYRRARGGRSRAAPGGWGTRRQVARGRERLGAWGQATVVDKGLIDWLTTELAR